MKKNKLTSEEALEVLIEGNNRFSSGLRSVESFMSVGRMKELAEKGQSPFAIVLTCSDSRVPTEMVFDQGLGDLFVVRVAGNVVSPALLASIEFAALNFGSPICIVMGHSECGAIKAAFSADSDPKNHKVQSRNLEKLINKIRPSVRFIKMNTKISKADDLIREATLCNVSRSVNLIRRQSPIIRDLVESGKLMIAGAFYDIHTGRVTFDPQTMADREERSEVNSKVLTY